MDGKILGMDGKIAIGIGYIFPLLSIIALIADKGLDTNAKFHLWQSILLDVAVYILAAIWSLLSILYLYPVIIGIMAFTGKEHRVPGLSVLVDKIAG